MLEWAHNVVRDTRAISSIAHVSFWGGRSLKVHTSPSVEHKTLTTVFNQTYLYLLQHIFSFARACVCVGMLDYSSNTVRMNVYGEADTSPIECSTVAEITIHFLSLAQGPSKAT